mmetsp:Transcript_5559/g.15673  ORF Transcript_5559/g.15673 Transcript_5559/m.15673 type:complete len:278 (-) Transcript_5559:160-993(-)
MIVSLYSRSTSGRSALGEVNFFVASSSATCCGWSGAARAASSPVPTSYSIGQQLMELGLATFAHARSTVGQPRASYGATVPAQRAGRSVTRMAKSFWCTYQICIDSSAARKAASSSAVLSIAMLPSAAFWCWQMDAQSKKMPTRAGRGLHAGMFVFAGSQPTCCRRSFPPWALRMRAAMRTSCSPRGSGWLTSSHACDTAPTASAPSHPVGSARTSSTPRYASGCRRSSSCRRGSASRSRSASVAAAARASARSSTHLESSSLTGAGLPSAAGSSSV